MDDKDIAKILKYSSPNSLFVVNYYSKLIELTCPFQVRVIINIENYTINQILTVTAVKVTKEIVTVFIICNAPYYYYYFEIL